MPALFLPVLLVSEKSKLKDRNAHKMPKPKVMWHFLSKLLFSETEALNFTFWEELLLLILNIEKIDKILRKAMTICLS